MARPKFFTFALSVLLCVAYTHGVGSEARETWWDLARTELAGALNVKDNVNTAKNIILFLGDGMGVTVNSAARIYKGQKDGMNGEEGYMAWERFPNNALMKTYNNNKQVADSASTATAYLCGVKVNYYTVGVDPNVALGDCKAAKDPDMHLPSVLQWAQEAGKDTGIVTTARVTHATPAATFAHSAHRNWECDSEVGEGGCEDITVQLVHNNPGKNIKVILGGGRQTFGAGKASATGGGLNGAVAGCCVRTDNRDLTQEWLDLKKDAGVTAKYVTTTGELDSVDPADTDYLLGLFDDSHVPYDLKRDTSPDGTPSLKDMVLKAISFMKKSDKGFFLLVEGGRIDHGLHQNMAHLALDEAYAMDAAVTAALKEIDLEETLVVVTADHSHSLSLNGYPYRGTDILGTPHKHSNVDGVAYTTLMFGNGPGHKYHVVDGKVARHDPSTVDLRDLDYQQQSAVPMRPHSARHGGEDVGLWAAGPWSHLFHRTHEEHYIPHVMAYAACIGPNLNDCNRPGQPSFAPAAGLNLLNKPSSRLALSSTNAKYSTRSPVLQELLDANEEEILRKLGTEKVPDSPADDEADVHIRDGEKVVIPHSL